MDLRMLSVWLMTSGVGPLAFAYCLYSHSTWGPVGAGGWARRAFTAYLHLECVWWLGMLTALRWLDAWPDAVDASKIRWRHAREGVHKLLKELRENSHCKAFLTGWIGGDCYSKLTKADVLDWWASVMCQVPFHALPGFEQRVLTSDIDRLEESLGKLIGEEERDTAAPLALPQATVNNNDEPLGAMSEAETSVEEDEEEVVAPRESARRRRLQFFRRTTTSMRLNLDSILSRTAMKPLWIYVAVRGVGGLVAANLMRGLGFSRERVGKVRFWVKRDPRYPDAAPLLFLHGIGIGLAPYAGLLGDLMRSPGGGQKRSAVVVLDMPCISMTSPANLFLNGGVPDAATHIDAVATVLARGTADGTPRPADLFAHSYGTVVAAWLMKKAPHLVRSVTLAEPVAVLIHHCHVARSFLYRKSHAAPSASKAASIVSFAKALHDRLLRMDPVIVHVLMRNFFWYENTLFIEDLLTSAHPTTVLLSENDDYTPSTLIRERIHIATRDHDNKDHNLRLVWVKGAEHGDFITNPEIHQTYVDEANLATLAAAATTNPTLVTTDQDNNNDNNNNNNNNNNNTPS